MEKNHYKILILIIVAYGAIMSNYSKININDITTKAIGIQISNNMFDIIIPAGTVLPLRNQNLLKFSKYYMIRRNNSTNKIFINIYEGNDEKVENNFFLGKIIVEINGNEEKIKISMSIDTNLILNVSASFENNKNKKNKIKLILNE